MYFQDCTSSNEVRKELVRLSFLYHPDKNPENEAECKAIYQKILDEYEKVSKRFKSSEANKTKYGDQSEVYETEINEMLRNIVDDLSKYHCKIEIVGLYVWVSETKREDKDAYTTLGLKWNRKHQKWFYTPLQKSGRASGWSFDKICEQYGCSEFKRPSNRLEA